MQCELERAIAEVQLKEKQESSKVKTTMVRIPEVIAVMIVQWKTFIVVETTMHNPHHYT
jgi:hypothetical protein